MSSHHRSSKGSSEPPPYVHRGSKAAYDSHPNQPQSGGYGGYGGYGGSPHGNQVSPYSHAPVVSQPGVTNNTIIVNAAPQQQPRGPRDWSSGLCACCDDIGICCCVFFCPCTHACKLASDMNESCCVPICVPAWLITLRAQMRAKENIQGSVMDDCCKVTFCGMCAQCQLAREVRYTQLRR